ncbi:MAG: Hsp70 family protein [Chthoniobacteraceae bacterium]|jgi:molecular chaperone DnaK
MSRSTIDYGIDLGTTNSAIAVLNGLAPEIVPNNVSGDITPSAVGITQKGTIYVGERGKGMVIDKDDDAYIEFKRQMGSDTVYQFKSSGRTLKPEELSAEVLKSLKADVQQRYSEEIAAAVITVPAAFELHQCDATRRAAELAGLRGSPLLQEPVAAALAYGFQAESEKAYWLVFDFGGGTFDAALIKADDGTITVVNHGGDNFLGGSDIDRALVERVIAPRIVAEYGLKEFTRSNAGKGQKWRTFFSIMKAAAEKAKIDISRGESASLEVQNLNRYYPDLPFDSFECEITRKQLVEVAEPIIGRAIAICKKVLLEKNLAGSALDRVILVGGPTLAPYFRDILKAELNANLDTSVNPLTVVAKGAAVFAGTQKLDSKQKALPVAGQFAIDLKYKAIGHEPDPKVAGRVLSADGMSLAGFTLELVNEQTKWRSGKITLTSEGTFILDLLAEKGLRNSFVIELRDGAGSLQKTEPDRLTYTIGAVVEEQPLMNSIGLVRANNSVAWFFKKGSGLPLKKKWPETFVTARAFQHGDPSSALRLPIVEGENDIGDRNSFVGSLIISGAQIKREIPAGSEVEVTLKVNESRIVTVNAYVQVLDEEFQCECDMIKKSALEPDLKKDCEFQFKRLAELMEKAEGMSDDQAARQLRELQGSELLREVRENLRSAAADSLAAQICDKRLLELKLKLDEIENALKWPTTLADVKEWRGYLVKLADEHGSAQQRARVSELGEEIDEIIERKQMDRMPRKLEQVQQLYYQILFTLPSFWVNQFQRLEKDKGKMNDCDKAGRLFEMGRNYLANNNVTGLQNVVRQLWDLTPPEVVEAAQRAFGAGLI